MSQRGAPAALGGYRVQALYTLKRIFDNKKPETIFQPEGIEDLDILIDNSFDHLIQVKRYASLQLSDLSPEKPTSFFRRAITALKDSNPPGITLVNFGDIGPELAKAWQGEASKKKSIRKKLSNLEYSDADIDMLFENIKIVSKDEFVLEQDVYQLIQAHLTGIDPDNAFDLLHAWLYSCMEKRQPITSHVTLEKINSVGRFLAERRDHHDQWFTSILPLETHDVPTERYEQLRQEFFRGGYTRYEHILADLDFEREQKIVEIADKIDESNIVIIHAASGQGKTTLALRYIHDNYPAMCRFAIARIEDTQHALSIANALNGHARAIQIPMVVYVDIHPRDVNWTALVGQLAQHEYLRVLVTVREEDYRRANVPGEGFQFEDLELDFDEAEAQLLYERARDGTGYLDFDSAWDAFGGDGPLLEFIHLLTQNTTLHQRLQGQIQKIQTEVHNEELDLIDLHLLRLISVATAYEARVDTQKLLHHLALRVPEKTLDHFQKEYLIRVNEAGYIEGLHAIRSRILVNLLTSPDLHPWLPLAQEVLPLLLEEDLETFLLYGFADQSENLLPSVIKYQPQTWRGRGGVLQGLLWAGLRSYIAVNMNVIKDARKVFGPGWYLLVDLNFSGDEAPSIEDWWETESLAKLFRQEKISQIRELRSQQTPKNTAFELMIQWFSQLIEAPAKPDIAADWVGVSDMLYWASRLGFSQVGHWLEDVDLDVTVTTISLPLLADLSYALFCYDEARFQTWHERHESTLEARLAQEYDVLYLEKNEDESILTAHFVVEENKLDPEAKDKLHAAAGERLQLIRQLYPSYDKYGSQGYGHKLGDFFKLKVDGTQKPGVFKKYLIPHMVTRPNQIATGNGRILYRPEDWLDYTQHLVSVRQLIVTSLEELKEGLIDALQKKKPVNVLVKHIDVRAWDVCKILVNEIPELPKTAVDQWGFSSETTNKNDKAPMDGERYVPKAIALRQHQPFLDAQRSYLTSIRNFMQQSIHVIANSYNLSRLPSGANKENILQELENKGFRVDLKHLSTHNLWEAKEALTNYQEQFQNRFGHLVDTEQLIHQERSILNLLWPFWYFYAHEPELIRPGARRKIPALVKNTETRLRYTIQQALQKVSEHQGVTARFFPVHPLWKSMPALWINLDVESPVKLDAEHPIQVDWCLEKLLIPTLQTQIGSIGVQELAFYIIQKQFKYLVVVLTVRGRMFNDVVMPLDTFFTILSKKEFSQENWVSYLGEPISTQLKEQLELESWDSQEMEGINKFANSLTSLMLVMSQISEFARLPGVTEVGESVLQHHLKQRSEQLSDFLNQVIDEAQILEDSYNSLTKKEKEDKIFLAQANDYLSELMELIQPLVGTKGDKKTLGLQEVTEYAQILSEVFLVGHIIQQYWLADSIT